MNLYHLRYYLYLVILNILLGGKIAHATLHNPALSGGRVLILQEPATSSPPVTINIDWLYGPIPTTGTLALTIESGSDKIDLLDSSGSVMTVTSWTSAYPINFQVRAKAMSSSANDIKLKIEHNSGPVRTIELTVIRLARAPATASGAGAYQSISTANANVDVLPGQKMYLKCEAPANLAVASYEWTLPGVTFKDYDPTLTQNQLTNLATSDKSASTVAFYWADTGDNREVACRVVISGSTIDVTAKLNVKKPTSTLSATGGNPSFDSAKTKLGMFARNTVFGSTAGGIVFQAGVSAPSGFSGGVWCYAQIVDATIDGVDSVGPFHLHAQGLDKNFPYLVSSSIYTSGSNESTDDSPHVGLADKTSVTLDESFTMYVMYKPSGHDSRYVPLRKLSWRMRAGATKTGGNWALTGTNSLTPSPLTDAETSTHPQWTSVAQDAQYTR